jgi:hypothetical protein
MSAACRFEITVDGCAHKLVIREAQLEDCGEYTVKIGDTQTTGKLEVEGEAQHGFLGLLGYCINEHLAKNQKDN